MFEKFAEDVTRRYQEKLAELMEKNASKWAREMVKRFGDKFTIKDFKKMYNAAYSGPKNNSITLDTLKKSPEAVKSPTKIKSGYTDKIEQLIDSLQDKMRSGELTDGQYDMFDKILKNRWKMNSSSGPYKTEFGDFRMDESLPAQKYFDFVDSVINTDTAEKLKGISTSESVAKAFKRVGGKNPVIKGLKSRNPVKNVNQVINGRPSYFTGDNKALKEIAPGPNKDALKSIKGADDFVEPVTFFSGYGPIADMYSYNGNYAVGNLDNIIEDLQQQGIGFSPNIGSFNPEYRKAFNDKVKELYGMPLHKLINNNNDPNLWRKSEIAIPEKLMEKLNPTGFHVFDPNSERTWRPFSVGTLKTDDPMNESRSNLKNFLKSKKANELQAIPMEDYFRGRDEIRNILSNGVTEANKNQEIIRFPFKYTNTSDYLNLLESIGVDYRNIDWLKPYI